MAESTAQLPAATVWTECQAAIGAIRSARELLVKSAEEHLEKTEAKYPDEGDFWIRASAIHMVLSARCSHGDDLRTVESLHALADTVGNGDVTVSASDWGVVRRWAKRAEPMP